MLFDFSGNYEIHFKLKIKSCSMFSARISGFNDQEMQKQKLSWISSRGFSKGADHPET